MPPRSFEDLKIAIIGLGYVGLPLAHAFASVRDVICFDNDSSRVEELKLGFDRTGELLTEEMNLMSAVSFTTSWNDIASCNCFIVTVPTPVTPSNQPDLSALVDTSENLASILKAGDLIIYESTVFPGAIEGVCAPILERLTGLSFAETDSDLSQNVFFLGYSPERINPGDRSKKIADVTKVTAGSTKLVGQLVDRLYQSIIPAGTHLAPNIRTAEAAKVIENVQRDVNIALVNELSIIFHHLNIDTESVLVAAGTKWNFLPFRPGLVGGHCIGVDPYYLTYKAAEIGYHPEMILAGRRVNDSMSRHVVDRVVRLMLSNMINVLEAKVLVLGLTFKENCPDLRNSKVFEVVAFLDQFNCKVDVYDPHVPVGNLSTTLKGTIIDQPLQGTYDAIIVAVGHDEFREMGSESIRKFGKETHVLFDVKYLFDSCDSDERL